MAYHSAKGRASYPQAIADDCGKAVSIDTVASRVSRICDLVGEGRQIADSIQQVIHGLSDGGEECSFPDGGLLVDLSRIESNLSGLVHQLRDIRDHHS